MAAKAMRSVLVDYARRRNSLKRSGNGQRVSLERAIAAYETNALDLIALDHALVKLDGIDPRLTRLVDLRFFASLSIEDTAIALGISSRTVRREWQTARAWLHRELTVERNHAR